MIPPQPMQTIKNLAGALLRNVTHRLRGADVHARAPFLAGGLRPWRDLAFLAAAVALATGCGPPGSQALIQGEKLLTQGKYPQAIDQFKMATSLLKTNAQAFNYLGLACHQAGQPVEAAKAYRQALALNPNLPEVYYNLGCLWLEQNRPDLAKAEFTTYTLLLGNSAGGFLKLASAQLRCRELAAAERSFNEALRLSPGNPEALTGMGVICVQRGRADEAAGFFKLALKQQPNWGPALLNLAIVEQQYLRNRQSALEHYRGYVALVPAPENADAVKAIMRQIEQELAPPARPAMLVVAAQPATNPPPAKPPPAEAARANPPAKPPPPGPEETRAAAAPRAEAPASLPKPEPLPPAQKPAPTPATTQPFPSPEVVVLPPEPVIKSAQNPPQAPSAPARNPGAEPIVSSSSARTNATAQAPPKRGFFQRINPLNLFASKPAAPIQITPLPAQPDSAAARTAVSPPAAATPAVQTASSNGRYTYKSPARPAPGNRSAAERALAQGIQAQQAQRLPEALAAYRRATQLDPDFFDAWYNAGVVASETGSVSAALVSYETALAIRPDSLDARYNFALLLKQAGYPLDAANELDKILANYPNDSRSHLALGNLYAQQLHQPAKAREHYLKALETDPHNPQAAAIRYWLMDNSR